MDFKFFRVTVKHDKGKTSFIVSATDSLNAEILVMAAESCPKCAIQSTKEITDKQAKRIMSGR